jgi:hypothetical protein
VSHGPLLVGHALAGVVQEVVGANVFLTGGHLALLALLGHSKVHVALETVELVELESSEGFVNLNFTKRGLLEGANWDDGTVLVDRAHNVAESVLLSESGSGERASLNGSLSEADLVAVAS